ncbi:MAG TPA: sigma 54-interacting transcriptional regulator [Polyangiaceae bacterium]
MKVWKTTVDPQKPPHSERRVPVVSVLGAKAELSARHRFDRAEIDVGRAVGAEGLWFPDDERVSRQHARLIFDIQSGQATLEDSSKSGTFVQGQRITGPTPLRPGDVVRVGDSFFLYRFEHEGEALEPSAARSGIVGVSAPLRALRKTLPLVGSSDATVVILGESGTGKELVARALHDESRRTGAFVAVNCAAIPEALAESQFFGHLAGAFTGAKAEARGFIRAAEGGTLFLDEIGELPLLVQPKLLRALEERSVTPVGSTQPVPCDVRIVAATNRDLSDRERFRADLFARISEFVLELPPLRVRREDVLPTLLHLLEGTTAEFSPELVEALLIHDYPHNVRDLRRVATQLRVRGAGRARWDLSLLERALGSSPSERPVAPTAFDDTVDARERSPSENPPDLPAPSRDELIRLLATHRGVVADIARAAGRSRKQVYRWIEQYGLALDDYRQD